VKFVRRELRETADISRGQSSLSDRLKFAISAVVISGLVYLALGLTGDVLAVTLSEGLEVRIFHWMSTALPTEDGSSNERFVATEQLFDRLLAAADLRPLPYSLHLLDSDQANAFALPGGSIIVTTELLRVVRSDVGMAMVLGHELGHQHHRHVLQRMGRRLVIDLPLGLALGGSAGTGFMEQSLAMAEAGHSRDQERDADAFGLELVYRVFGHTEGSIEFFEHVFKEYEKGSVAWGALFASHPPSLERILTLRRLSVALAARGSRR
jgi:predicted Zn-dependent protease